MKQRLIHFATHDLQRAGREVSTRSPVHPGEVWTKPQPSLAVSRININASRYPETLKLRLYCGSRDIHNALKTEAADHCREAGLTTATITTPESQNKDPSCRLAVVIDVAPSKLGPGVDPRLLGPEGWGSFVVSLAGKVQKQFA